jgi:hypothetical protein
MEELIYQWFNEQFCDKGLNTEFYNLALQARDDLIQKIKDAEEK